MIPLTGCSYGILYLRDNTQGLVSARGVAEGYQRAKGYYLY